MIVIRARVNLDGAPLEIGQESFYTKLKVEYFTRVLF